MHMLQAGRQKNARSIEGHKGCIPFRFALLPNEESLALSLPLNPTPH